VHGAFEWVLWTANDLEPDFKLRIAPLDAKITRTRAGRVFIRENIRGWSAGWEVRHGGHRDEIRLCMSDSEPGAVYLRINEHVVSVGVSPLADAGSALLTERARDALKVAFRERLLATTALAVEAILSA